MGKHATSSGAGLHSVFIEDSSQTVLYVELIVRTYQGIRVDDLPGGSAKPHQVRIAQQRCWVGYMRLGAVHAGEGVLRTVYAEEEALDRGAERGRALDAR